jgi:hypothetical protein
MTTIEGCNAECVCVRVGAFVSVFFLHESSIYQARWRLFGYLHVIIGYLARVTHNGAVIGVMRYVHVA